MATRDAMLARILRRGFALVDAFSARLGATLHRLARKVLFVFYESVIQIRFTPI